MVFSSTLLCAIVANFHYYINQLTYIVQIQYYLNPCEECENLIFLLPQVIRSYRQRVCKCLINYFRFFSSSVNDYIIFCRNKKTLWIMLNNIYEIPYYLNSIASSL